MKYRIELTETQLNLIMKALERFFRTNMGQFAEYTDDVAFEDFTYDKSNPENSQRFDIRIDRRNVAQDLMKQAYRVMKPEPRECSEDTRRAIDIFDTFRYALWDWKPEPKDHNTVESRKPLPFIDEELPKIERI